MTVRDLGYRPYEGERLPATRNTFVLLRHGMTRAWASWLVKLAVLVTVGVVLVFGAITYLGSKMFDPRDFDPVSLARVVFTWLGPSVLLVSLGAGSGVIANDSRNRAFQFYFSKPVTPEQYLLGRTLPVSILVAITTFGGALLEILVLVGIAGGREESISRLGLLFPALGYSVVIGLTLGPLSVAVSSFGKSRTLTMMAWTALFVFPHSIGWLVDAVTRHRFPWLLLGSVPALLGYVGDALFRRPVAADQMIHWYHAAPLLALLVAGGVVLALYRLRRVEVVG